MKRRPQAYKRRRRGRAGEAIGQARLHAQTQAAWDALLGPLHAVDHDVVVDPVQGSQDEALSRAASWSSRR